MKTSFPVRGLPLFLGVFLLVGSSLAAGQELRVAVANPSAVGRSGEPVVIPWSEVSATFPGTRPEVAVTDANGRSYINQIDDLDFDGVPDELTFVADFNPGEEKVFTVRGAAVTGGLPSRPRTDAADWKKIDGVLRSIDDDDVPGSNRVRGAYRFDGVGWESEVTAYRLYLDDRNAVDILGKHKPGLYWNFIGTSGVDYQNDADWGMDVLHVGSALGIGGIGFWVADSVLKPLTIDRQRTRIIARGPVRAVVSVTYEGWDVGGAKVTLRSTFLQYAGERACEQSIRVLGKAVSEPLAAGIVRHDSTTLVWNAKEGWLSTSGYQSRAGDSLMLALNVPIHDIVRRTEGAYDHVILLNLRDDAPVRMLISYVWQGETGRMWSAAEIERYLHACARRLNEPLVVRRATH